MFEKIAQVVSLSLAGAGVSWEREVEIIAGQSSFDLKSQCHFLYKQSLELAPLLPTLGTETAPTLHRCGHYTPCRSLG